MIRRLYSTVRAHPLSGLELAALVVSALTLRFVNVGYSNFQGDEIKSLCFPSHFTSLVKFLGFLLTQRKGPVEFVVTCTVGLIDPAFSKEALARLPFTLASLLGLACLFWLAWQLFNRQTALYATFFLATDGIFVAFGRIVQYQSFVILGVAAALLTMILAIEHDRWRAIGPYIAYTSAACALLAHFDAAFVLPPLAVLTVHWWLRIRRHPDVHRLAWHFVGALSLAMILVGGFYVEYVLHLGSFQVDYWQKRLAGAATDTLRLAFYYNPAPFVWFTLAAAAVGLTRVRLSLAWQVLLAWLIPPLIFMEMIFPDSGTHAYAYFLPLLLIAGVGLQTVVGWIKRGLGEAGYRSVRVLILALLILNATGSYLLFVDHSTEYPWRPKSVLGTTLPGGLPMTIFGFPYNRGWRAMELWFAPLSGQNKVMVTNERPLIPSFYLPNSFRYQYLWSDTPETLPNTGGLYFLVIERPQSGLDELWGWTTADWRERLTPTQTFFNPQGQPVARVYFLTREQRADLFP